MESLAHLEALCERLYNSQDSAERAHAENTLKCFSVNSSYIAQCQYILDNASTPYALMLASSSLLKQVTEQRLSLQTRLDIRNYLINYLATRGIDLEPFVTASLIQLFCRVTKYGWFEDDIFREVVKESTRFLNQSDFNHSMASDHSKKKDIGWNYGMQGPTKDSVICKFCKVTYNGGISRHKQHLMGGNRNVKQCPSCPPEVREEIRAYVENKKVNNPRYQMRQQEEPVINVDYDDDMDEFDEMMPPSKSQKMSSSGSASSTGRNVTKRPLNLYFSQKSQQRGGFEMGAGFDETKKILRERAVSAFALWMYDAGLPFNCVNHKSFDKFIEAVGQHGPGMKPPTFHEVRVTHLKKEVKKVDKIIDEHRVQWTKFGCSIMMDKWTAQNGKMIINILVNSPIGSVFLNSVDASNESTDSTKMFNLFESTIKRIGPENVVQVVTDNASENVKAGSMIMGVYPHIYWTPCAAHCINLMFGDIFKINPYASVFKKAIKIYSYISQRPLLLNLMRKFTNERNLVKPAKTRFATAYLTMRAMYNQKKNLRMLVLSTEWTSSRFAKESLGKDVANLLISAHFWNDVVRALKVCGPLTTVLRLVDGERKPPMGYIYEAMDRAKEAIAQAFGGVAKQYEKVFEIIDARWTDQLHRPLHAAGFILNPGLFYKAHNDGTIHKNVWPGYHACVEKMNPDITIQDLLVAELPRYKNAEGLFGCGQAQRAKDTRSPVEWWSLFGCQTPNLQKFAMKVLSLTCSSSGCERNWSVFEHTASHYAIGLKILNQLVSEMNQPSPGLPSAQHRRVACSFRDQLLLQVFQVSLTSMTQLKNDVTISKNAASSKLQELVLALSLKCLSFDFMGTTVDESLDDFNTIQIPSSWKQVLEDQSTVQIFFDYYEIDKPNISKEALECLVRLASVRRSLFSNDTSRVKYLAHLMTGTKEIMQTGKGLACHDNYHEFCRLLGRFKVNYQLSELVNVESYGDWIRLVAEFTLRSLQSWQWASSSIYYLLGLWSRLVSSVPYLKGDTPSLLSEFVPEIVKSFITSRFGAFQGEVSDLSENPLDNVELLQDQLDCLPNLCRFQYESCSSYIMQITDPLLQMYMESADPQVLTVVETKFAWIVHIIAAIVKTKQLSGYSGKSQEIHDAELSARVLRLINVTDSGLRSQRYAETSKQRLDLAILVFFQNFRKSYVGDQAIHSSKQLYTKLAELLGLHDHMLILNLIVGKIATNLKLYRESDEVIDQTLNLMLEMASGYMTAKLLIKLDTTQLIISNQNREEFPFLGDYRCSRSRTTFYYIIGLLIFMEDSFLKFKASMDPLLQVLLSLELIPDALFHTDDVKQALIGLMRDLRGIAMATSSRRTYSFLFDWLYPAHIPLLLKSITIWADTPEVTTPLLKFVAEFVLNKSQRLNFETSSPCGILLFREVSKLIVAYGSRILSLPNHVDMYQFKYKGVWISLTILSRALAGNYVNFGVFEIYGDRALADAFDIAMRMALSIPLADILSYRKLSGAYFTFLEIMMKNQIQLILNLDSSSFTFIAGSLESGLKVLDANIKSQCASAVDNLATFYFEHITTGDSPTTPVALNLAQHLGDCPNIFLEILKTLLEIVLFEDCGNQWSLSRPMLSMILISEEMFSNLRAQILSTQPADQQHRLSLCFDKLMADITRSLDQKNRDKFSNNLTRFRNEFRTR